MSEALPPPPPPPTPQQQQKPSPSPSSHSCSSHSGNEGGGPPHPLPSDGYDERPRRNKSSPPIAIANDLGSGGGGGGSGGGGPPDDGKRPCGYGLGAGGGGGPGGGGGGAGAGAGGGGGGGGGGGKKRPCACKASNRRGRALSEADVSVAAETVVATVTTAAAFAISAARAKQSERMTHPVVIMGVVEARCPEDEDARSVAVFKREPGKRARVANASGTKFAQGLSLQDDLSFHSVGESQHRGPRHSSGTRHKDAPQIMLDSGKFEPHLQTLPGGEECAQCMCCERCRESKCQSERRGPDAFFQPTPDPPHPSKRGACRVVAADVLPEPPSEQLYSEPSGSSPAVTVRQQEPAAAQAQAQAQEQSQSQHPSSHSVVAPRSSDDKLAAEESLSMSNPLSEEDQPPPPPSPRISPRPSLLQLPLPPPPPPPPQPRDQPLAILSSVPAAPVDSGEVSQLFAPRSADASDGLSEEAEGGGHEDHEDHDMASDEEPCLPEAGDTTFSESRLTHSATQNLVDASVSKVLEQPRQDSSPRESAVAIPSDKSVVPGSSGSLVQEAPVREAASDDRGQGQGPGPGTGPGQGQGALAAAAKELLPLVRSQDLSVVKSLLRMDAVDFIDVLLPLHFVADPYERRKTILTNIETFFNRLHPLAESDDVVQRRTVHFFEARKLAELIAPWNDIDEAERKLRAAQFAKQVMESVAAPDEGGGGGENKEMAQIRAFVETFLESIAAVSQSERKPERRRARRLEAFDKLERSFPIKRTLSLQKRSNIEGEIEVLLDKLVPHKQPRDGEERLNALQSGVEELLETMVLSADARVALQTRGAVRMLAQGFLEDMHSADMMESECERASQLRQTIERFAEAVLPSEHAEASIRMGEVRRLVVALFKDVVIRAQDEKCALKRTKLRSTGRSHLGKIMYIAEEGRKRKSSVLLRRPQESLYTVVPEERIKNKEERRTALHNWLENLLENIILSLRTVSFVYRKSSLHLLVNKFVRNLMESEEVEDEFERRNLVQSFERELLEKVIPQSAVEDSIVWSKMNTEMRMLLDNVVPLVHKENNPSKRGVLRSLAQEHLQFVFSVTEKVEKWKCCFEQNRFDERLDSLVPEEMIKDKDERKGVFIQGVTELLESFVLYEDMGSTVQRRNILFHIVEKFADDIEKAESLVDKKDRVNELHRLVEKLVDIIIPISTANDILRESHVRKEIVCLLKYSILPCYSEENQAKRRIFRSVASEYLLTIDPGEATNSDPSARAEEAALLEMLFPIAYVEDREKRKLLLIEGIRKLVEEIVVSCKPVSPLNKKMKLMKVVGAFVENAQITTDKGTDKHKKKSQIFHQVEGLVEQIIPMTDYENNMRLCQTRRELTYLLETVIVAASNPDNITRGAQRTTAKKHLHKILLISCVPRNRTATLEKARSIVEYMIPEEHKDSGETVSLLERSIREICEEIIVFVGDECDIRTNSELGSAVSTLVANIRGLGGSESPGDGKGRPEHLEEVVSAFLERILPHQEREDNVVKSCAVKEVAQLLKDVVAPSLVEKSYARKSALRSLAMHHLQRLSPIVSRERKATVNKTKELLNELVPAELVKDKKKRKNDLVRVIQNLLESCVSSVGIESLVEKNIMNEAVQIFLDDLERIRQRIDKKDRGEVTDVVTKLLGTVLPEAFCNDLCAGKLRKEIHRLLEDIVTPLQTGLRKSSANILRSSASNILENIMAVSEVLKSRRHRICSSIQGIQKSESKEFSTQTVTLGKVSNSESEKLQYTEDGRWDDMKKLPMQQPDETIAPKMKTIAPAKESETLSILAAATGNVEPSEDAPSIFPKSTEIVCQGCILKNVVDDAVTKSIVKDSLEITSIGSESCDRGSEGSVATCPDDRVVSFIAEQLSGGPSAMTIAKDPDEVSDDVKSQSSSTVEEKHSKILDKIIPAEFEPDAEERKSNLKTGIKDFIESIILSGVYNRITMKSQLDGIVENFVDKIETNVDFDDRCQDSSEKQLFVTDLIEEVMPSSQSDDSRLSAVRKESAKLLNNIVLPSLSIRDVGRRSSLRFNAKELLESIIQEPDVPQVNYQAIMEKLFPKGEVEEKQEAMAMKELAITELLETIILFVDVGSLILRRSTLRSIIRQFLTNVEEAGEMEDEEERQQEKTVIVAELVKKVIPEESSDDIIMVRRLREDLLHFMEIVFNTNYGEDVTRAVDAQKAIESIFAIIGAFSRRDSNIRYQKYCDTLDALIPERLEGAPQDEHRIVKKGIEELLESVVLTMDTHASMERRTSLCMATQIFMQNLQDIKEMSVFVQDKAEKLVVADLIKKIFPNTSVNDSIHLLEVRRQTTSLLYKSVIPALDERNLGRRHLLKTVARERLDNIVLLEELSERNCVSEEEIVHLMNKLVPLEFIDNREKRFCHVQRGIESLLEKIILSTEVGKDISMSSVHKFIQMMIDNISELGEEISLTEQNFHLEKYTTHLIDGIIPAEEADDNIRLEKLRNVLLEMLEDVLIIQIVCDGSKISLIRSLVHEKLLAVLSIIKRLQSRSVSAQLKEQVHQIIDDMVPERHVDDEDIRMCILHNAIVDFLKEVNMLRGGVGGQQKQQASAAEGALKKEVEMLLSDISSMGDVKDRSSRSIRAEHGVALFVRKLVSDDMTAKHTNMTKIRSELQRLLMDVIIPAQAERCPHERTLLREKGVELLEVIVTHARTACKEMQLEEKRTLAMVGDLVPKYLDPNMEARRAKLLNAVREFLQKMFPSGNVIMSQCRTIHNKLLDYATTTVTLKDPLDLEDKRGSLRRVMHEVLRILSNVLEEHTDLRVVSLCLEDLLLNVIPRGQFLRGMDTRIMLRGEARHLMDVILTQEAAPADSEASESSESRHSSQEDSSTPWDEEEDGEEEEDEEDGASGRHRGGGGASSKRFLNFIFPWTRKKKGLEETASRAECSSGGQQRGERDVRHNRSKKSLKRKRNV